MIAPVLTAVLALAATPPAGVRPAPAAKPEPEPAVTTARPGAPSRADSRDDPDAALLRDLELLERLELLDHLELFDEGR